jgi:ferric-dicitrate binding protein FerR (iron transport regulator)
MPEDSMRAAGLMAAMTLILIGTQAPTWASARNGGVLMVTEGTVRARTASLPKWHPAAVRSVYMPGDALMTGRRSRAEIAFGDGTITRIAPVSILHLPKQAAESFGRLLFGRIWMKVTKQQAPISVHTPAAVATIVGTELIVTVDGEENTRVACLEGAVKVQGLQGPAILIKPGQQVDVRMGAAAEPPTVFDVKRWQKVDPLLANLKQTRGPEDDDPDGYKSLMQQLGDTELSDEGGRAYDRY